MVRSPWLSLLFFVFLLIFASCAAQATPQVIIQTVVVTAAPTPTDTAVSPTLIAEIPTVTVEPTGNPLVPPTSPPAPPQPPAQTIASPTVSPLPPRLIAQVLGGTLNAKLLYQDLSPAAKTRLMFQVTAYDPAFGNKDGDGIKSVEFTIRDDDGNVVYEQTETTAAYCAFGGNGPCNAFAFKDSGFHWPHNGPALKTGTYHLRVRVVGQHDGNDGGLNFKIQI